MTNQLTFPVLCVVISITNIQLTTQSTLSPTYAYPPPSHSSNNNKLISEFQKKLLNVSNSSAPIFIPFLTSLEDPDPGESSVRNNTVIPYDELTTTTSTTTTTSPPPPPRVPPLVLKKPGEGLKTLNTVSFNITRVNNTRSFLPHPGLDLNKVDHFMEYVPLDYENGNEEAAAPVKKRQAPDNGNRQVQQQFQHRRRRRHRLRRRRSRKPLLTRRMYDTHLSRRSFNANNATMRMAPPPRTTPLKRIITNFHEKVARLILGPPPMLQNRRHQHPIEHDPNPAHELTPSNSQPQHQQQYHSGGVIHQMPYYHRPPLIRAHETVRVLTPTESKRLDRRRDRRRRRRGPPRHFRPRHRGRRPPSYRNKHYHYEDDEDDGGDGGGDGFRDSFRDNEFRDNELDNFANNFRNNNFGSGGFENDNRGHNSGHGNHNSNNDHHNQPNYDDSNDSFFKNNPKPGSTSKPFNINGQKFKPSPSFFDHDSDNFHSEISQGFKSFRPWKKMKSFLGKRPPKFGAPPRHRGPPPPRHRPFEDEEEDYRPKHSNKKRRPSWFGGGVGGDEMGDIEEDEVRFRKPFGGKMRKPPPQELPEELPINPEEFFKPVVGEGGGGRGKMQRQKQQRWKNSRNRSNDMSRVNYDSYEDVGESSYRNQQHATHHNHLGNQQHYHREVRGPHAGSADGRLGNFNNNEFGYGGGAPHHQNVNPYVMNNMVMQHQQQTPPIQQFTAADAFPNQLLNHPLDLTPEIIDPFSAKPIAGGNVEYFPPISGNNREYVEPPPREMMPVMPFGQELPPPPPHYDQRPPQLPVRYSTSDEDLHGMGGPPLSTSSRENFFRFNHAGNEEDRKQFEFRLSKTISSEVVEVPRFSSERIRGGGGPPPPPSHDRPPPDIITGPPPPHQGPHSPHDHDDGLPPFIPPVPPRPIESIFDLGVPDRELYKYKKKHNKKVRGDSNAPNNDNGPPPFINSNFVNSREAGEGNSGGLGGDHDNAYSTLPDNWEEFRPDPSHSRLPKLTYDELGATSRAYKLRSALTPKGIMKAIMSRFPRGGSGGGGMNRAHTKFRHYDAKSGEEEGSAMGNGGSRGGRMRKQRKRRNKNRNNPKSIQDIIDSDQSSAVNSVVGGEGESNIKKMEDVDMGTGDDSVLFQERSDNSNNSEMNRRSRIGESIDAVEAVAAVAGDKVGESIDIPVGESIGVGNGMSVQQQQSL